METDQPWRCPVPKSTGLKGGGVSPEPEVEASVEKQPL